MKEMTKKIMLASLVLIIVPFVAFGQSKFVYDVELLPGALENGMELLIMLISVIAAAFAIKLAALSQGGQLEKTWNWLAIAAGAFAVLEIFNGLEGFGLVHLGGLDEILELIFAVILVMVFIRTRKDLLGKVMGK